MYEGGKLASRSQVASLRVAQVDKFNEWRTRARAIILRKLYPGNIVEHLEVWKCGVALAR